MKKEKNIPWVISKLKAQIGLEPDIQLAKKAFSKFQKRAAKAGLAQQALNQPDDMNQNNQNDDHHNRNHQNDQTDYRHQGDHHEDRHGKQQNGSKINIEIKKNNGKNIPSVKLPDPVVARQHLKELEEQFLQRKVFHLRKELHKAAKKSRALEAKKIVKKIKEAKTKEPTTVPALEAKLENMKHANLDAVVDHVYKKVAKELSIPYENKSGEKYKLGDAEGRLVNIKFVKEIADNFKIRYVNGWKDLSKKNGNKKEDQDEEDEEEEEEAAEEEANEEDEEDEEEPGDDDSENDEEADDGFNSEDFDENDEEEDIPPVLSRKPEKRLPLKKDLNEKALSAKTKSVFLESLNQAGSEEDDEEDEDEDDEDDDEDNGSDDGFDSEDFDESDEENSNQRNNRTKMVGKPGQIKNKLQGKIHKGGKQQLEIEKRKKNRPGQKSRQLQWQKQYGRSARHLQKKFPASSNPMNNFTLNNKRPMVDHPDQSQNKRFKPAITATYPASRPQSSLKGNANEKSNEKLHPSWEAKRKAKEQQSAIHAFQGQKIVFD